MSYARIVVLVLVSLSSVACGGLGGGSADAVTAETGYGSASLTQNEKASLSLLEGGVLESLYLDGKCDFGNSEFAESVESAIALINFKLDELKYNEPLIEQVVLLSGPPRLEGFVAIFLCDGLGFNASTLHRSSFISNGFLADLHAGAVEWGDEDLFNSAVSYIVFHEFAHAVLNHSAVKLPQNNDSASVTSGFDYPQEVEADRFAYNLMVMTGQDLLGMVMAQSLESL